MLHLTTPRKIWSFHMNIIFHALFVCPQTQCKSQLMIIWLNMIESHIWHFATRSILAFIWGTSINSSTQHNVNQSLGTTTVKFHWVQIFHSTRIFITQIWQTDISLLLTTNYCRPFHHSMWNKMISQHFVTDLFGYFQSHHSHSQSTTDNIISEPAVFNILIYYHCFFSFNVSVVGFVCRYLLYSHILLYPRILNHHTKIRWYLHLSRQSLMAHNTNVQC